MSANKDNTGIAARASLDTDTSTRADASQQDVEKQSVHHDGDGAVPVVEEKAPRDPNIVDWDSTDDPQNPMNWPTMKKVTAVGLVSLCTFLSPLASTIISPASQDVMATFHSNSDTLESFITSVYLIGYVFGPLFIAPLSELYGRSIMYNTCNFFFLIWSIACAVSNNLSALIVFRLLAGIAGSCPVTVGSATIADTVPIHRRGLAMVFWISGPLLGPTIGPLAGGYLAEAKNWRWIFWLTSMLGGAIFLVTLVFLRETNPSVILKRKTERLRKETGNPNLRSALESGRSPKDVFKTSITRPLKMLFFSPIVFLLSAYVAVAYGILYLLLTTFPRVFHGQYGFSVGSVGLVFIGFGVGAFITLIISGAVSDRMLKTLTARNGGSPKPEYRLPLLFAGAFLIPISLFLYGWTADKKVHWIVPIIGTAILGMGQFAVLMPVQTYLVDAYTVYAASATAAATVFRSLLGALLPLAGNPMFEALGIGWGASLLGFIAVAFIPVPFIFWTYGERIRNSKLGKVEF